MPAPFEILYEDDDLFAINKPAWWVVHRGMARDHEVIVDVLKTYFQCEKIHPLHRLDRQTSGTLLFAKSSVIAREMQHQFDTRKVGKKYIALVRGICPDSNLIDQPVPRTEGGERVPAQTKYVRIAHADISPRAVSLVQVFPQTGRFHQIRRHMKHISHPIIGDANYGKGKLNREIKERYGLGRMALHAMTITFAHPVTAKETVISAQLPEDLWMPFSKMGFDPTLIQPN